MTLEIDNCTLLCIVIAVIVVWVVLSNKNQENWQYIPQKTGGTLWKPDAKDKKFIPSVYGMVPCADDDGTGSLCPSPSVRSVLYGNPTIGLIEFSADKFPGKAFKCNSATFGGFDPAPRNKKKCYVAVPDIKQNVQNF